LSIAIDTEEEEGAMVHPEILEGKNEEMEMDYRKKKGMAKEAEKGREMEREKEMESGED